MKNLTKILYCLLFVWLNSHLATYAQVLIAPANPSSEDSVVLLTADPVCERAKLTGNLYNVEMVQNNITVTFLEWDESRQMTVPQPLRYMYSDIGRLPQGNYTVTTVNSYCKTSKFLYGLKELDKMPFTVTNARLQKKSPWVSLNHAGHWWNPNDSGVGLFVWHDAADNILAAWFTYTADGKPAWYVFQPKWDSRDGTTEVDLFVASRPPGSTSPPQTATSLTPVGKVLMVFNSDTATLVYQFGDGSRQRIDLVRFKG